MSKIKNIKDLRDSLLESFEQLQNGNMDLLQAKELSRMSGKVILSAKTELDYNKFMNKLNTIDFLEVNDEDTKDE